MPNLLVVAGIFLNIAGGQPAIEYLGLPNQSITALGLYNDILTAGTQDSGVFFTYLSQLPDPLWTAIGLQGKFVTAVYPHKSGPLAWGVTAGVQPEPGDSIFVYCSFAGDSFYPNSAGIRDSLADRILDLAGFPDPSVCGEKYAAAGTALYRQEFGDTTWVPIYTNPGIEGAGVVCVKTRETAAGLVLAGGSEGFTGILLLKSTDYGSTWEHIYPPGPVQDCDFGVDSTGQNFGTIFVSNGYQISRSLDGGDTWEMVLTGIDMASYFRITFDPSSSLVVASANYGWEPNPILAVSTDAGQTWQSLMLPQTEPVVDHILGADGYYYFATSQGGVFRIPVSDLGSHPANLPTGFRLYQNHPNPFNSVTSLRFDISRAVPVRLTVIDITGKTVAELWNGIPPAGSNRILWKATNLPSGIYIARLESPAYTASRKMILVK